PAPSAFLSSNLHHEPRSLPNRMRQTYADRLLPTIGTVWAIAARERVTAGHMARMAIQEGSLVAAYRALLPRLDTVPEAHRVISEIITRRANAVAFFTEEALARIRRSRAERLVAGAVLAVVATRCGRPASACRERTGHARASFRDQKIGRRYARPTRRSPDTYRTSRLSLVGGTSPRSGENN